MIALIPDPLRPLLIRTWPAFRNYLLQQRQCVLVPEISPAIQAAASDGQAFQTLLIQAGNHWPAVLGPNPAPLFSRHRSAFHATHAKHVYGYPLGTQQLHVAL